MPRYALQQLIAPWTDCQVDAEITGMVLDNRKVRPGDLFVAVKGHQVDARRFIPDAVASGCAAVLATSDEQKPHGSCDDVSGVPVVYIDGLGQKLSAIANRFFAKPAEGMTLVGVTGTNGKTTISQLAAQWAELAGECSAVMGTTGNGLLGELKPALNTTGSALEIVETLAEVKAQGASFIAMEVSSHGLVQGRVADLSFDAGIFTNLSRDHLDYHGTMEAYGDAKQLLFTSHGCRHAIINADDSVGSAWLSAMPEAIAVSMAGEPAHPGSKLWLTSCEYTAKGVSVEFDSSWGKGAFTAPLIGEFNVSNLLLSLATLLSLGYSMEVLLAAASGLHPVIGRMEVFQASDKPMVVVDYAHTPDALEKALHASRRHCDGELWCLFGCGGDRDTGKRPMMAAIAEKLADRPVLTDDNPRSEDPALIVADMVAGLAKPDDAVVIHDRAAACRFAIENGKAGDVILVAGKGHEDYQVLASGTVHYSDRETVQQLLGGQA
ncbi:UDP-N-acetylmuramoyl-L-alanyl-D-glutamate--2,6-diaminopimelate ligase [Parasalinivibrio latis]|uniref:UDP-N-acetylmuramoyl-L-alanyl-D-glutamate--2, 6-diaminopimelate ligase n=1 Tax=Parasalinivibrio latis TaxID=2952610 RepID=UPI0030E2FC6D